MNSDQGCLFLMAQLSICCAIGYIIGPAYGWLAFGGLCLVGMFLSRDKTK